MASPSPDPGGMPEALQLLRGLVSAVHTLSSKLERVEGRLEQLDGVTAAAGSPSGRRSSPTAGGGVRKRATVFDGDDTAAMLDQLRVSKEQQKAQAVFDDDGDSDGDEEGGVGGGGDDAEGKKERNGATRKSTSSGKTSPLGKKSTSKLGALAGAAGFSKSWGRNKWRNAKSKVTAQLGPVRIKLTPAIVQPEPQPRMLLQPHDALLCTHAIMPGVRFFPLSGWHGVPFSSRPSTG